MTKQLQAESWNNPLCLCLSSLQTNIDRLSKNFDLLKNEVQNDLISEESFAPLYNSLLNDVHSIINTLDSIESGIETKKESPVQKKTLHKNIDILANNAEQLILRVPKPQRRLRCKGGYIQYTSYLFTSELWEVLRQSLLQSINKSITICMAAIYPANTSQHFILDNDNFDLKQIIDIISTSLSIDDRGNRCSMFYISEATDIIKPGFYIEVLNSADCHISKNAMLDRLHQK